MNNYGPPLKSKHTEKEWPPAPNPHYFFNRLEYSKITREIDLFESLIIKSLVYGAEYVED
jgi:hypothetical protein